MNKNVIIALNYVIINFLMVGLDKQKHGIKDYEEQISQNRSHVSIWNHLKLCVLTIFDAGKKRR